MIYPTASARMKVYPPLVVEFTRANRNRLAFMSYPTVSAAPAHWRRRKSGSILTTTMMTPALGRIAGLQGERKAVKIKPDLSTWRGLAESGEDVVDVGYAKAVAPGQIEVVVAGELAPDSRIALGA